MADRLIRQEGLAVLHVKLDVNEPVPAVVTELLSYMDGVPRSLWRQRHRLEAFGLNEEPPNALQVPDGLRDHLGRSWGRELHGQSHLWLRLEPAYGYLGAVPWERALQPVCSAPLFRVPARLFAVADPGRIWSAAIVVSVLTRHRWAAEYVTRLVHALEHTIPGERDVRIFTDAGTFKQLGSLPQPWVHVHKPQKASQIPVAKSHRTHKSDRDKNGSLSMTDPARAWTDWIVAGFSGSSGSAVRTLHVVLDAAWDVDRPMLAISPAPGRPATLAACQFMTAEDIRMLSNAIGAATLSFGSPPDSAADSAMRLIADRVGQQRQGPTIYSSLELDPTGRHLARMYGFLSIPGQTCIPDHPSLFSYVQPEHVQAALLGEQTTSQRLTDRSGVTVPDEDPLRTRMLPEGFEVAPEDDLSDYYAAAKTVPLWVAASERYIDSSLAGLAHDPAVSQGAGEYKRAYDRGAAEALADVQGLVARHVDR